MDVASTTETVLLLDEPRSSSDGCDQLLPDGYFVIQAPIPLCTIPLLLIHP
jgi:hypothetical protein